MEENSTSTQSNTSVFVDELNNYHDDDGNYQVMDLYVILVGLLGVLDNTFVVVVIVLFTKMKNRISGLLILNQTVVDLAASALLVINYMVFYNYGSYPGAEWKKTESEVYCRLFLTEWLQWGLMISSTANLVLFNLERYLSVVHPIFHKGITKKNFAIPGIVIVWVSGPIYGFLWAIPSTYMEDGWCMLYTFNDSVKWSTAYGFSWVIFNFFIPLASMLYFYSHMVVVLGKSNFKKTENKSKMSRTQKSLLKTMAFITLAFIACMTWDNVNWLLYTMGVQPDFESDVYYYSYLLSSSNACINPFIYIINYRDFQLGMRKMMCKGRVSPEEGVSQTDNKNTRVAIHA